MEQHVERGEEHVLKHQGERKVALHSDCEPQFPKAPTEGCPEDRRGTAVKADEEGWLAVSWTAWAQTCYAFALELERYLECLASIHQSLLSDQLAMSWHSNDAQRWLALKVWNNRKNNVNLKHWRVRRKEENWWINKYNSNQSIKKWFLFLLCMSVNFCWKKNTHHSTGLS